MKKLLIPGAIALLAAAPAFAQSKTTLDQVMKDLAALTDRLRVALTDAGVAPTTGSAWTVDAPFRETVIEARHYADDGVAVVLVDGSSVGALRHDGLSAPTAVGVAATGGTATCAFDDFAVRAA